MEATTSTTTDPGTFTLRAWPRGDSDAPRPLAKLIERINTQEGSFRNIAEEALEASIRKAGPNSQPLESTEDEPSQDAKSRKEQVIEAKADIIKLATQAWTESSHTLDLISLVVSQYNPKVAEYTMTPFIKQTVPMGSLGAEVLEVPKESEGKKLANDLTSFGWKLESLAASADSLLRSATNLESEMEKEAKYWDDVLMVKSKGWSICSLPRERHTLGVRYGFLESGPEFRDRGLAALRRGDEGGVELDLGDSYPIPRSLRVQVREHGEIIATAQEIAPEPDSIEASILQARNNLFDEELYHEMNREARALTNRGVKCVSEGIVVPLEDDKEMLISLIDEDDGPVVARPNASATYSWIPAFACTAFRLLLSHSHRQHYLRRTALQPPLKKRKQQRPMASIIQPIISHLEHRSRLARLTAHLHKLNAVLTKASVPWSISAVESNLHIDQLLKSTNHETGFANAFLDTLCSPLFSSVSVQFGPEGTKLKLSVRTHSSGTEFRAEKSSAQETGALNQTPDEMKFSDLPALEAYLSHLVVLHLVDLAAAQDQRWQATDPDEGELTTEPTLDGVVETMSIKLRGEGEGGLELAWRSSHAAGAAEPSCVRWGGTAEEGKEKEKGERDNDNDRDGDADGDAPAAKSFQEEVARLSSLRVLA